ncbi:MAG TPA: aminotransferase class IV, partial [Candidatus Norongarragalinales archaeon]|nr:aminotransferase class IV [Candidatus Norongarragalinales archaeon]
RIDSRAMPTRAKISGNYANSQLASEEARSIGFDEAILLNYDGFVSEGPGENIFIVKDGVLVTPPLSAGVLPGITRGSVLRLAKDHDIEVQERDITRSDLYTADEAFFSGTAAEITPIRNVDGIGIGDGKRPVTQKVQKLYSGATHGLLPKYREWLEYV